MVHTNALFNVITVKALFNVITVKANWLSMPGDYSVTDEALLAETT